MPTDRPYLRRVDPSRTLLIDRMIAAPPERIWRAFSSAAALARWWGPDGFTLTTRSFDFRAGGAWDYVLHGPDGADYPNHRTYTAIVPEMGYRYRQEGGRGDDRIAFEGEVRLEPVQDLTRIVIDLVFESAADLEKVMRDYRALEGGRQTLARLAGFVSRETG